MKTIIVAVDFSSITSSLIDKAAEMAMCSKARVYIVHVASPDPNFVGYIKDDSTNERQWRASELKKEKKDLEKIAERLKGLEVDAIPLLIQGATAEMILNETQRLGSELLIMGMHGHGVAMATLLGSTSHQVLKHVSCPILLIPCKKNGEKSD